MAKQSQPAADQPAVPVLLTRPLEQSRRLAGQLQARFLGQVEAVLSPLMHPVHLPVTIPDRRFVAVVFTSEAAVHASARLPGLPEVAFCVGSQTASAATAAGFSAQSADGDAEALFALINAQCSGGPLLYLHGRETRGDLAERLFSAGLETVSLTVYQQDAQPLTDEAQALLARPGPVIVPLFSPRTAELLAAVLPDGSRATIAVAAMSDAVARNAQQLAPARVQVAARPDLTAMLDAVEVLLIELRGS